MPEITQFKEALLEGEERSAYAIVPIPSSNSIQISKHTFSLFERKTIDQITELNASYDILAKNASTHSGKPWFFIGCTSVVPYFNPDTEEIEANKFSCVKCKKQITATQMRYKLYIQAIDHTSTASFLLFDDVVIPLVNKSAYDLREQQVQILIPDTTARNSSYRVVSLTEDPNVIKDFTYTHSNLIAHEGQIIAISGISDGTKNQTHNVSSEAENLDFSNSGNVSTSTPGTKRSQDVSSYVLENLDSPNSSDVSMSTKTLKRLLSATEDVGVQYSSTKQKLLLKNQIKKEKK
ncbi:unnamed protein product [Arabis nemorensis]|uniref:Replication factor A C-terminal domain-containing protein n=1 Tax=Arabis nemorensis TaxID=586526 RepID=A0A565AXX0_9BRAS|nr:unnamed protein product [Arabis nemorensis]